MKELPNGRLITIKRGEIHAGLRFLSDRWGWSVEKTQRYINKHIQKHEIERRTEQGESILILCNYEYYNPLEDTVSNTMSNTPPKNPYTALTPTRTKKKKEEEYIPPYSPPKGDGAEEKKKRRSKTTPEWKPERFEGFWAYYPRGENRMGAVRAWDKLKPDDALIETIGRALQVLKASPARRDGAGIPYAPTSLNGRRWEDAKAKRPAQSAKAQPVRRIEQPPDSQDGGWTWAE